MLFDSTLRKDLARSFGATFVVIITIVLTMMLIRTLGQAAVGHVAPQDVALLMGYVALGYLPLVLALSLFIAVVATLGRMYRDSEMVIWFVSGIGLTRFVRPVLRMARVAEATHAPFKGMNRVQQQRAVYASLKGKMAGAHGELHALALTTKAP